MKLNLNIWQAALILFITLPQFTVAQNGVLASQSGTVTFTSNAPLEIIKASTDKLKGAIDTSKNTFAFAVEISAFKGFNGDLQREHFHENYLETDKYPSASFAGKLIEKIDFKTPGNYTVRAKGMLILHGVQQERIIRGVVAVTTTAINILAVFTVQLEDHNIKVPKIVNEKIAEEIKVNITIQFKNKL